MPTRSASDVLVLFALWLVVFSASSQVIVVTPILPEINKVLEVGEAKLGDLVSAYAVMLALFALVAGPISDKIGRRRILLIGTGTLAAALYLHWIATTYASLLGVRALAGAAGGMLSGAAVAYVGDYFPYERRGWANGWVMSGIAAGQILGVSLGKIAADALGYRWPFIAFAVTMTLATLLIWRRLPQPDVALDGDRLSFKRALRNYGRLVVGPVTGPAVLAYVLMFFSIGFFVVYLSFWLETEKGLSGPQIALLFAIGGTANLLAGPRAGALSDRIGRKPLIIASSALFGVLMLATTFVIVGFWTASLLFALAMVTVAMRISPLQSLLTALVPDRQRGILMSLAVALGQGAFALAGKLSGPVYVTYGYVSNTVIGAASIFLMALLVWKLLPEPGARIPTDVKAPPPEVAHTESL